MVNFATRILDCSFGFGGIKDFLHPDKHQTILQFDTNNLGGYHQACPNYPQKVCKIFAISQLQEKSEGRS